MRIYLDYAATTPCDERVVRAMSSYHRDNFGNPSSPHTAGGRAQEAIEVARGRVAKLIGASSDEIVFTGSGTESDNTAIKGVADALRSRGNHIITSKVEHHAVIESCHNLEKHGFSVTYLPVDKYGAVSAEEVERAITDQTVLVSIMHANNEVGTIQPIEEIGRIVRERGVVFHTDAVQTAGCMQVNVEKLGVDLLSLSAHKIYGPKGTGVLYVKKGTLMTSLLHGGEQEGRRRAATENVPGIVGFGEAVKLVEETMDEDIRRLSGLQDRLCSGLLDRIEKVQLNGHPENRLPGIVNVSVAHIEGEAMVLHLDAQEIMCSTGSACSAYNLQPSHVLIAMGLSHELAHGSLRFSLGRSTTEEHIDKVLDVLPGVVKQLRAMSPLGERKMIK